MVSAVRPFWPFRISIAVRARVVVVRPRPAPRLAVPAAEADAALARAAMRSRLSPHLLRDLGLEE